MVKDLGLQNSLEISSASVFAFLQDVQLIQQESWFVIGFIFLDSC